MVFLSKKILFFSCKISVFAGMGALFGTFFVNFLSFLHAKFLFFARLGGLFELKKTFFFKQNFSFWGAG